MPKPTKPPKKAAVAVPRKFRGWDRATVSVTLYDGSYMDLGRMSTALFNQHARTPDLMVSPIIKVVRQQLAAMVVAKRTARRG